MEDGGEETDGAEETTVGGVAEAEEVEGQEGEGEL